MNKKEMVALAKTLKFPDTATISAKDGAMYAGAGAEASAVLEVIVAAALENGFQCLPNNGTAIDNFGRLLLWSHAGERSIIRLIP